MTNETRVIDIRIKGVMKLLVLATIVSGRPKPLVGCNKYETREVQIISYVDPFTLYLPAGEYVTLSRVVSAPARREEVA